VGQKRPNAYNAYDHVIRSCNINTLFPFLFYFSKVILFIINEEDLKNKFIKINEEDFTDFKTPLKSRI